MILIDKDSLIEHMRKAYEGNTKNGFKWDLKSTVAVIGAEEDAEPIRHGHWIPIYLCETHIYKCSYCHTPFFALVDRYHYCPNCGASMDAKGEDDAD